MPDNLVNFSNASHAKTISMLNRNDLSRLKGLPVLSELISRQFPLDQPWTRCDSFQRVCQKHHFAAIDYYRFLNGYPGTKPTIALRADKRKLRWVDVPFNTFPCAPARPIEECVTSNSITVLCARFWAAGLMPITWSSIRKWLGLPQRQQLPDGRVFSNCQPWKGSLPDARPQEPATPELEDEPTPPPAPNSIENFGDLCIRRPTFMEDTAVFTNVNWNRDRNKTTYALERRGLHPTLSC
ncbi:hypothetical protein DFS34DRAFT_247273 [Phlyctochytrium arcticum]|nr:hypothetical protein DFS34DRAFT_247273 [Phlyctochytrium arcticum]